MKQILLTLLIAFFGALAQAQQPANPRNTLWLNGPSLTSAQWDASILSAQDAGYKFNQVNTNVYNNGTTVNDIPTWAGVFNTRLQNEGFNDVLGIGHDAGGLILRYMAQSQTDNKLSAMILNGVPNQGGQIYRNLLSPSSSTPSGASLLVSSQLAFRTVIEDCLACFTLETAEEYLNQFANPLSRAYYQYLVPESPVITNLQTPQIPYAVIWGNEDEGMPMTRMINSWSQSATGAFDQMRVGCLMGEMEQAEATREQFDDMGILQCIGTSAGLIAKIKQHGAPLASNCLQVLSLQHWNFLIKDSDYEKALDCLYLHEEINLAWVCMFSMRPFRTETQVISVPECALTDFCSGCWLGFNPVNEPRKLSACLAGCIAQCEDRQPFTLTFMIPEPTDGLYTKTEQLLAGAAKTYEAQRCNHFQESFWEYTPIRDAFTDLFNGGAGAAFVVPKN